MVETIRLKLKTLNQIQEKQPSLRTFGVTDTQVSVANTTIFARFEGISTSRGYALLNNEIVEYNGITAGAGNAGSLSIDARGQLILLPSLHTLTGEFIQPYEVNGVSLTRINTSHDIPSTYYNDENSNLDNYYLEFDRTTCSSSLQEVLVLE